MSESREYVLGRKYELYIGRLLENDGYTVLYTGIIYSTEDNGVDLVAINDNAIKLVQCKWRNNRSLFPNEATSAADKLMKASRMFNDLDANIDLVVYTSGSLYDCKSQCVRFEKRDIPENKLMALPDKSPRNTSMSFQEFIRAEYNKHSSCTLAQPNARVVSESVHIPKQPQQSYKFSFKTLIYIVLVILGIIGVLDRMSSDHKVYIASYSGTKYHSSARCEGLENAASIKGISITDAKDQGYKPCGYCYR